MHTEPKKGKIRQMVMTPLSTIYGVPAVSTQKK